MMASFTGPLWRKTYPGTQVRPVRGQKRGEVVAVLDETADGVPKHVLVVWDHGHPKGEQWASDCLDIVQEPKVDPLKVDPLFEGLCDRALPWLLVDHRLQLQELKREQERLYTIWRSDETLYEEMCQLATKLDHLDVSITLTQRLVDRLVTEIAVRQVIS